MPRSFDSVFYGAAGGGEDLPSDDQFNRVSFLSHFDGANNGVNNAFDDGSTSNHTITANGDVTQGSFGPFARPDGEWAFNNTASTNDSFKVTAHDNFDMTNPFTIEGWIFLSDLTANKLLFGRENNYWMTHDYQSIGGAQNKLGFNYQNSGSWGAINASAVTVANTWYFLQATYVGTTVTFYINGVSQGTASVGSPSSNTDKPFYVLSGPGQKHTGTASNVRLSSVARSTSLPTAKFTSDSDTELLVCQSNRFVDNSPDGHTITTTAGASVSAFGPFLTSSVYDPAVNGASLFNSAASDYLSFGNIGLDGHSGDFSIEGWIYPTAFVASSNPLYTQGSDGGVSDLLEISLNSSGQPHAFINQGSITLQSTFVCPLNAWTFLQLKRTSGTLAIFTNGVQSSTVSNTATISSPNRGFVGAQSYDTSHADRSFYGFICDVRVSVVTRSVSLPTAPLAVIDSNTKLLLNMADGQAIDQVAKSNIVLEGNAVTSTTQKKIGTASFYSPGGDGDKGLINTAGGALLPPYNWTIEVWTYCTNSAANQVVFAQGLSGGAGRVALGIEGSVYLLQIGTAKPQHNARTLNQWVHLCATYDGTTAKLYIDGTLASSGSVSYTTATDQNLQAGIGNLGTGWDTSAYGKWYGYIDELRVSRFIRHTGNFSPNTEAFPDKGQ